MDESEVGSQTICLQAVPVQMSRDDVVEWVGEEVLKEYNNLHHNRGLQGHGDRSVHYVSDGPSEESAEEGGARERAAARGARSWPAGVAPSCGSWRLGRPGALRSTRDPSPGREGCPAAG